MHAVGATHGHVGVVPEVEDLTHRALAMPRMRLALSGHRELVVSVAWSPDGKSLATASADRTAKVWDVATGRELLTLAGHTDFVRSVAWSPDGRRLATVSADRTARVWAASGRTLLTLAGHEDRGIKEHPLEAGEAVDLAIQIAEALGEAHQRGVIHRDIKGSNLMVTDKGQVKVMDFGLAKVAGEPVHTREGATLGTAAYMSPEQARGEQVDQRTDL